MREITAELADNGFLRHIGDSTYMTTEDGYKFIQLSAVSRQSLLSNDETSDSLQ